MTCIDFTHVMNTEIPVFPGDDPPAFFTHCTLEKNGFLETRLDISSHTGTHIDAPAHMLEGGLFLNQFPLDKFMGNGIVADVSEKVPQNAATQHSRKYTDISKKDLGFLEPYRGKVDFILLHTGWSTLWETPEYLHGFPTLNRETAQWLSEFGLKGIGTDTVSIDSMTSEDFTVHKILMKKNILIIENLVNLSEAPRGIFPFSCIPLSFNHADGSPVRAFTYAPASGFRERM